MHEYQFAFKCFIKQWLKPFRIKKRLTQIKMSEILRISPRSYSKLENGEYWFSGSTMVFLLLSMTKDEVLIFIEVLREAVAEFDLTPNGSL